MYKQDLYWDGILDRPYWMRAMPDQNADILPVIVRKGKHIKNGQCVFSADTKLDLEFYIDGEKTKVIEIEQGTNKFKLNMEYKKDVFLTARIVNRGTPLFSNTDFLVSLFIK